MFGSTGFLRFRCWLLIGAAIVAVAASTTLSPASAATPTESAKFVNQVFRDLMLRPATPVEIAHWTYFLNKGVPREQMLNQVQRLPIHRCQQVRRLFTRILGRLPDWDEQHLYEAELIAGRTVEHVAAEILALPEFYFGLGGGTDEGYVNAVFLYATGSLPTPEDHTAYVLLLKNNSDQRVARMILNTDAAFAHLSTMWHTKLCRNPITSIELAECLVMFNEGQREESVVAMMMAGDDYFQYAITHN